MTGAAYDSTRQLIGGGPLSGVFYTFDPRTLTWAPATIGPTSLSLAFMTLVYVPQFDVYWFVSTWQPPGNGHMWAYKPPAVG